jgi:hypothetical protein
MKSESVSIKKIKPKINFMLHSYAQNLSRRLSLSLDKLIIAPLFGFAILGNYSLGIQFNYLLQINLWFYKREDAMILDGFYGLVEFADISQSICSYQPIG